MCLQHLVLSRRGYVLEYRKVERNSAERSVSLGASPKVRKATVSFMSVRMEQRDPHSTDFDEMLIF